MLNIKKGAFTLVELIVVVTILAILSTIGFVSYSGYLAGTRDTNRISQLESISEALEIYKTTKFLPIPDDKIDIKSNGNIIAYQGYIGKTILELIKYTEKGIDPKDKTYFSYYLTKNKKFYQLMGFLEENSKIEISGISNKINAIDYNIRYPTVYGKKLGIFTDEFNIPIQENSVIKSSGSLDISTTNNIYIARFDNSTNISGTGGKLKYLVNTLNAGGIAANCQILLDKNHSLKGKDGIYLINPEWNKPFKVYCDMTADGGGWTGLFSLNAGGTTWRYDSSEWTNPTLRGLNFTSEETTYKSYSILKTNQIKICRLNTDSCYIFNHQKNIPLKNFYTKGISYIDFSRLIITGNSSYDTHGPDNIGKDKKNLFISSLGLGSYTTNRNKYGAGINIVNNNKIGLQFDDNNSWPSYDNEGFGIGLYVQYPNFSCSNTIDTSVALSTLVMGKGCYYENPDVGMWYVYAK